MTYYFMLATAGVISGYIVFRIAEWWDLRA